MATQRQLRGALDDLGRDYVINEGDGAFYGPKIDFMEGFHQTYLAVWYHPADFRAAAAL